MSILQKLVQMTEGVEGLNGVNEGLQKLVEANGATETAAAVSQLTAELAITTAVTATVRTLMSALRLGLAISGQIWKWEALSWAAGATSGLTAGAIIDWVNKQNLGSKLYDLLHPNEFDQAKKWTWPRDPIILDLDGDGLETVGLAANIHFDHDGDGVLTKTGWAGKDDALLVWDRNANGTIDTGAELFGDFTVLPNGTLAPNGFAALAALDANGDGILDASDPAFVELKLWRDVSQDGVSQGGEFITLADAGIVSLNLVNTLKNQRLANGNTLSREGSFTRADGTTSAMGEFKLAADTFSTKFAEQIEVSESLKALPNMGGVGNVRDLQQAAAQSNNVADLLTQFQSAPTRAEQKALLDQLITAWADTSGMAKSLEERAAGEYRIQYEAFGNERRSTNLDAVAFVATSSGSVTSSAGLMTDIGGIYLSERYRTLIADWNRKLHVLEAFNGQYFFNLPDKKSQTNSANWGLSISAGSGGGGSGAIAINATPILRVNFSQSQLDPLQQAYDGLKECVYASLVMQTRLKPYLDQIELVIDNNGLRLDVTKLNQKIADKKATDPENYLADLLDLDRYASGFLSGTNWNGLAGFDQVIETLPQTAGIVALLSDFNVRTLTDGSDELDFTDNADIILAGEGNDTLYSSNGNDRLFGQGGDDRIYGGNGDDLLSGGAGNDVLIGEAGADTYIFGRGFGNDTVIEDSWLQDETNRIELLEGLTPADLRLERIFSGNGWQIDASLRITIRDTSETLTVKNHFNESNRNAVDEIIFADGTVWNADNIKSLILIGEAGNEELLGFNDRNDIIQGGTGNDCLMGLSGDDVLDGGADNDLLIGGAGADTYHFGTGEGQDIISEGHDAGQDVLQLGSGVTPDDVTVRWTILGDMAVTLVDGSRVTVRDQANPWSNEVGIEQLHFADGMVWDRATLSARALSATLDDDTIVGGYLDDLLDGGAGNDRFQDLGGYDTYRFGVGDGQDVIEDTSGRVLFKQGIVQNDVAFTRDGNDLIATISASRDSVRVKDWLNSWRRIDRFIFANDTQLNVSDVQALLNVSAGAEILYGAPGDDTLTGTEKDSIIYGREGNDTLVGGAGGDELYGEGGNDTLVGGTDRDWLYGGEGNNTYAVAPGMGLDNAMGEGLVVANDTVVFAPGIRPEDVSVQLGDSSWDADPIAVGYTNLVIGIGGNDALVLHTLNWGDLGGGAIQHFHFDDGTQWSLADLIALADGGKMGWQQRNWGDMSTVLGSQADDDIYDYTGQSITVQARGNDDSVQLEEGNDIVSAGAGNDTVNSGQGDDVIAGETGDDRLNAGAGDDTVVFNYGDGHDKLAAGEGQDTLSFGVSVTPDMLSIVLNRDGRVMLLVDGGAGGTITLTETLENNLPGDLERVQFIDANGKTRVFDLAGWLRANSTVLLSSTVDAPLAFVGLAELTGSVAPAGGVEAVAYAQLGDLFSQAILDHNTPTEGDDVLYGTRNGDILEAGDGNDIALGLVGDDTIFGGEGNDLILGGDGDDVLEGNAGDDVVRGGWGSDQLAGGTGRDELYGEWGGDNYAYQSGHGEVIIDDDHRVINWGGGEGGYDGGEGGTTVDDAANILNFGPGIRPEDLYYSERNGDLVIEFANQPGDRVILRGYMPERATQTRSVDIIRFADGAEIMAESIEPTGKTEMTGDEGGWLNGTQFSDTLIGGDGDDVLDGKGGTDRLVGGVGSDTYRIHKEWGRPATETLIAETWRAQDTNRIELTGEINVDDLRLEFDGHDLLLRLTEDGDVIRFVGFDPRAQGMQAPVGEISLPWQGAVISFEDLVARGVRYGGHTNDVYDIFLGDGEVIIDDLAEEGAGNVLRFGAGIDPNAMRNSLRFEADDDGGYVLLIPYGDEGDVVRLTGFDPEDVLGTHAVDRFEFADGTAVDYATLISWTFVVEGDNDGNVLSGTNVGDRLYGYDSDDVMEASDGDDVLTGGTGNDVMQGGAGRDAYVVGLGDGEDVIEDNLDGSLGNVLTFGEGIARQDVRVEVDGDDLLIQYGSGSDLVRVNNYAPNGADGGAVIDTFEFADGTAVTLREFLNRAPEITSPINDQVVLEDEAFSLALPDDLFIDADGDDILTRVAVSSYDALPVWLQYDAATRILYGTPDNEDVGEFDVIVQGMDTLGASSLQSFHVTVKNTNDAPEAGPLLAEQHVLEDAAFTYALPESSFLDIDVDDGLSFSASLENGNPLPEWLSFDAQTQTFSGQPDNGGVGSLKVRVTATDLAGASVDQLLSLEVLNTNDAPATGVVIEMQQAFEDATFTCVLPVGAFADADVGDHLSFSATLTNGDMLPSWLNLDAATGTFSGTPSNGDVGDLQICITATDQIGAAASQTFGLVVGNTNDTPSVAVLLADQQATEDAYFTFTLSDGTFQDVDAGDALTLSATRTDGSILPSWLSFDEATRTFSGLPANDDVGSLTLKLTATDEAGAQASQTFNFSVANVNDAPKSDVSLIDLSARVATPFTWQVPQGTFVDVDAGDTLTYSAHLSDGSTLPEWLVFDAITGNFNGTPAVAGSYAVQITATDQAGAAVSQAFKINVVSGSGNQAPVTAPDTATVTEDRKLFAWGNVLTNDRDPEGRALRVADPGIQRGEYGVLALLSNGAYAYVLNDCSTKVQGLGAGEIGIDRFSYLASDGTERSSSELTVAVQGTNDTPELVRRLADVQLAKGKAFSWQIPAGSFTDQDSNDSLSYKATLKNGKPLPTWLKFNAETQAFSGATPTNAKGSIEVKVVASDGHGECSTTSDVFKVGFGSRTGVLQKVNGGLGNRLDTQPSEHGSKDNDCSSIFPGNPVHRSESKRIDNVLDRFLDGFKRGANPEASELVAFERNWFAQHEEGQLASEQPGQAHANNDFERHWSKLTQALNRLDAEHQGTSAWSHPNQGADLSGLVGVMQGGSHGSRGGVDAGSLTCGSGTQLKAFTVLKGGFGKLPC